MPSLFQLKYVKKNADEIKFEMSIALQCKSPPIVLTVSYMSTF